MAISKESFMRVYVDDEGKYNVETPKGEKVPCVQRVQVDQDANEAPKWYSNSNRNIYSQYERLVMDVIHD